MRERVRGVNFSSEVDCALFGRKRGRHWRSRAKKRRLLSSTLGCAAIRGSSRRTPSCSASL